MATPRIHIVPHGRQVRIRPDGWMGDAFNAFRQAISGATWDRKQKASIASIDRVPTIVHQLRLAGFSSEVDSEVLKNLEDRTAQKWMELQAVRERVEMTDRELKERDGSSLWPFQKRGAVWLARRRGALLLDQPRLGKTVQTLVALPAGAPSLVVCPASVKGEWAGAVRKWRPQIRTVILEGREKFRWPQPGEMIITNYDILPDVHDGAKCDGFFPAKRCTGCASEVTFDSGIIARTMTGHRSTCTGFLSRERCPGCHPILAKAPPNIVLVLDEAHRCKNSQSIRAQRAQAMADAVRTTDGRVWELTGTPLENKPPELWCLMRIAGVGTEAFPLGWQQFAEAFGGELEQRGPRKVYVWKEPKPEASEGLAKISLRRLRSQVWTQLPAKRWNRVVVPIDRRTLEMAEKATEHAGGLEALLGMVEKEKAELGEIARMRSALATAKIPFLFEYLKDRQADSEDGKIEPVVVFSMHRAPVDLLAQRKGWAAITGDVSAAERTKIVAKFQTGALVGLACTIPAAGEGLNLSIASEAIFVDLAWKPTANEQAEDRLVHIDRPRDLVFTILEANHAIDRRVMDVCMRKRRLIGSTVDASSVTEDVATVIRDPLIAALSVEADAELYSRPGTARRVAVTDEEKALDVALQKIEFEDLGRQRLTTSLAEELAIVGLTDKQWQLAAGLAASVDRKEPELRTFERTNGQADQRTNGDVVEEGEMSKAKRKFEAEPKDEAPDLKAETLAWILKGLPKEKHQKLLDCIELVEGLDNDQRRRLFGYLEETHCVASGVYFVSKPDHLCDECEEDEDEDEDENEDEEDEDHDDDADDSSSEGGDSDDDS